VIAVNCPIKNAGTIQIEHWIVRISCEERAVQADEWTIAWSDILTVGVPELDREHRQFILRVNALNRVMVDCRDKATVRRVMELMLMEASQHIRHEEQLLARWKYPDIAVHAHKHVQLTAQLDQAMKQFEEADVSYVWAVKALHIKQRLVDHLLMEDMKYRDFLRTRKQSSRPSAESRNLRKHVGVIS
jgi:hemerythrin-like metal-binding protein